MIYLENFDAPAWNRSEIMRYARIRGADNGCEKLIDECIALSEPSLTYRVCYTVLPVTDDGVLTLGSLICDSQTVRKAIRGAGEVLLFAATIGAPFDRLIRRYAALSPSKAMMLQAIGAERVESLCDAFCEKRNTELAAQKKRLTLRVSPGYGDIALGMQKDIFAILDCPRKIGLSLDESLMMSPSKSVTAICGIVDEQNNSEEHHCAECDQDNCMYRSVTV